MFLVFFFFTNLQNAEDSGDIFFHELLPQIFASHEPQAWTPSSRNESDSIGLVAHWLQRRHRVQKPPLRTELNFMKLDRNVDDDDEEDESEDKILGFRDNKVTIFF